MTRAEWLDTYQPRMSRTGWILLWLLNQSTMNTSLFDWSCAYMNEPSKWLISGFREAAMQRLTIAIAYTSDDRREAAWRAYPGLKTRKLDVWVAMLNVIDQPLLDFLYQLNLETLEELYRVGQRRYQFA